MLFKNTQERIYMKNKTFKKKTLGEELAGSIRDAILNGGILQNSWIKEDEISKQFGVSRTPVREALTILENEGLISSISYKGKRVIGVTSEMIKENYLLMATLESLALELVFNELNDTDFEQLDNITKKLEISTHAELIDELTNYHREFHWFFIKKCKMPRLIEWLNQLYNMFPKSLMRPTRLQEPIEEYKEIIQALRKKRKEEAVRLMKQHILKGSEAAIRVFTSSAKS